MWAPPSEAEVAIGAPVLGRTLVGLAGALTHLAAVQCAGFVPISAYQGKSISGDDDDDGWMLGEAEDEEHRVPVYVPMGVDAVTVHLVVMGYAEGGTEAPEVSVSVIDGLGGVVDAGFTLDRATGLGVEALAGGRGARLWPKWGQSIDATLALGTKAGSVVVLRIDTTRCMLVSALLVPAYPETL
jgi:hypothetical protein